MKTIFKARGPRKAEVMLYDDIGSGWFGGISAKEFADELKALGTLDEINVRINSGGGSVFDGVAIYNTLKRNGARIVVDVEGLAASIASLVAMAGDEIRIAANSFLMIHDPWTMTAGTADDLRKQAETMDKIRDTLVTTYSGRSGTDEGTIRAMMAEETWMTAEEALNLGFANEITDDLAIAASIDPSRYQYQHVPSALQAKAGLPRRKNTKIMRMRLRTERLKV